MFQGSHEFPSSDERRSKKVATPEQIDTPEKIDEKKYVVMVLSIELAQLIIANGTGREPSVAELAAFKEVRGNLEIEDDQQLISVEFDRVATLGQFFELEQAVRQ